MDCLGSMLLLSPSGSKKQLNIVKFCKALIECKHEFDASKLFSQFGVLISVI